MSPEVPIPENPLAELIRTLDLSQIESTTREDVFVGPSQWIPHGRV